MLRKLWQGIAEYADAVVALLLAVTFGLLGALGVVSQSVTSGGILTTLAVLAIVILRDRVNKVSLDRQIRVSTDQSREVLTALPSRLARIDNLAGSIDELRRIIEGSSMARALHGGEVKDELNNGRRNTDRWFFKGGTGTFTRAVTLPQCAESAQVGRRTIEVRLEIIDPTDFKACERYEGFRRSVSTKPDGTGETWYAGRARLESYATIVAACWYRQKSGLLDIQVGLTRVVSTFRFDMSSEHLIITQDDPRFPALLVPRDKSLYDAYGVELRTSFEQAHRIRLENSDKVGLKGGDPTCEQVQDILEALEVSPNPPLSRAEADVVVQKAIHAKNPYDS